MPTSQRAFHDVLHEQKDHAVHQVLPRHLPGRPPALRGPRHCLQPGDQEARACSGGQYCTNTERKRERESVFGQSWWRDCVMPETVGGGGGRMGPLRILMFYHIADKGKRPSIDLSSKYQSLFSTATTAGYRNMAFDIWHGQIKA